VTDSIETDPVFVHRRRIEFADTDVGGIVHFSRFFVFMETAEHEMLRNRGTTVHLEHEGQTIGWPRVEASCSYYKPAKFGEEIEIEVRVKRRGVRSMTYGFRFQKDGELLAEGHMTSVCCVLESGKAPEAIPIPDVIGDKLPGEIE
jgi:4-hydroxybenzoyl-CoA thioesterase/acyl-CoA thioester hydrolase